MVRRAISFGISMMGSCDFWHSHLLNISIISLPGKKVVEITSFFSQMNMGAFSKKILGKIWLSYGQKQKIRGAQLFSYFFQKWVCRGLKSVVMVSNMWDIFYQCWERLHGYPTTLRLGQFKTVFLAVPNFCLSMVFSAMPILVSGAIFSAPYGSTLKWKLTGHTRW